MRQIAELEQSDVTLLSIRINSCWLLWPLAIHSVAPWRKIRRLHRYMATYGNLCVGAVCTVQFNRGETSEKSHMNQLTLYFFKFIRMRWHCDYRWQKTNFSISHISHVAIIKIKPQTALCLCGKVVQHALRFKTIQFKCSRCAGTSGSS